MRSTRYVASDLSFVLLDSSARTRILELRLHCMVGAGPIAPLSHSSSAGTLSRCSQLGALFSACVKYSDEM